jgi:hypothetical protein
MLYSVQTSRGSDEIVKRLDGINEVKSVVRMGTLRTDLERLFGQLSGRIKTLEFVRSVKHSPFSEETGYRTSDHVAKLWANDEIVRILNNREEYLKDAAINLAVRYQLVTPVSNAVVVEMAGHHPSTDIRPVDTEAPSRSEVEVETLLLAGLFALALIFMRHRPSGSGSVTV